MWYIDCLIVANVIDYKTCQLWHMIQVLMRRLSKLEIKNKLLLLIRPFSTFTWTLYTIMWLHIFKSFNFILLKWNIIQSWNSVLSPWKHFFLLIKKIYTRRYIHMENFFFFSSRNKGVAYTDNRSITQKYDEWLIEI